MRQRVRHSMRSAVTVIPALLIVACVAIDFPTTKIPEDAHLKLSFACPKDSARTDTDCRVNGQVLLNTNDVAGGDWIVDLLVDKGSFVPQAGDSVIHARRLTTSPAGEVSVLYHTPVDPADVIFTLTGQGVVTVETLKVVNRDAGDDPAVSRIVVTPTTLSMKIGDSVETAVKFLDASGHELKGRLAYFSMSDSKASVPPGPADHAWVKGIDTGTATLHVTRRAILTSVPVTVTP